MRAMRCYIENVTSRDVHDAVVRTLDTGRLMGAVIASAARGQDLSFPTASQFARYRSFAANDRPFDGDEV